MNAKWTSQKTWDSNSWSEFKTNETVTQRWTCFKSLRSNLYKFEPRRKYVEELGDTDDSDSDAPSDDNDVLGERDHDSDCSTFYKWACL